MKLACVFLVLFWGTVAHSAPLTATTRSAGLPDAVNGVTAAAQNNGYQLVKVQPIDEALVKRGYPDPGVRIVFICKSSVVKQATKTAPKLLSLLPFKLTLIVNGEQVMVSSDDLEMWKEMFPDRKTIKLIEIWEHDLKTILSDYAGG